MDDDDGTLNKRGEAYCACRYLACGRKFKSLKSLEQHLITYHNITWEAYARYSPTRHHETVEESVDDHILGKRKDAYCMCTYMECGRKFKMLKNLEEHVTLYHNISWQLYTQYYHRSVRKTGEETQSKSPKAEKKETQYSRVKSPKSTSPRGSGSWYSDSDSSPYVPITMGMPITPSVPGSPVVSFMPPSSATYIPAQYPYMTAQVPLVPTIIQYQPMLTPPMLGYASPSSLPIASGCYGQPALSMNALADPSPWLQQMHQQDSGILNLSCPKSSKSTSKENLPRQNLETTGKTVPSVQHAGTSISRSSPVDKYRQYTNELESRKSSENFHLYSDRRIAERAIPAREKFQHANKGVIVIEPDDQFDEKLSRDPGYVPKSMVPIEHKSTQMDPQVYSSYDAEVYGKRHERFSLGNTIDDGKKIPYSFQSTMTQSSSQTRSMTSDEYDSETHNIATHFRNKYVHRSMTDKSYENCDDKGAKSVENITNETSTSEQCNLDDKNVSFGMTKQGNIKISEASNFRNRQNKGTLTSKDEGRKHEKKPYFKPESAFNYLTPVDLSRFKSSDLSCTTPHHHAGGRRIVRSASLPNLKTSKADELTCDFKPVCIDLTTEELQNQKIPSRDLASCKDSVNNLKKLPHQKGKKCGRRPRKGKKDVKQVKPLLAIEHGSQWKRTWWTLHLTKSIRRKYIRHKSKMRRQSVKASRKMKKSKEKLSVSETGFRKRKSVCSVDEESVKNIKYLFNLDCDSKNESFIDKSNLMILDCTENEVMSDTASLESASKKQRLSYDIPSTLSTEKQVKTSLAKSDFEKSRQVSLQKSDSHIMKCALTPNKKSKRRKISVALQKRKVTFLKELADAKFRSLVHSTSSPTIVRKYTKNLGIPRNFELSIRKDLADPKHVLIDETPTITQDLPDRVNRLVQFHRRVPNFVSTGENVDDSGFDCGECGIESLSNRNYVKHRFESHSAMKCQLCEKNIPGGSHLYRYLATIARHLMVDHGITTALDPKDYITQKSYAGLNIFKNTIP